jgi:demethylmenaquinone methyltransferase/2-methoxy-6-polyprenyl-1,4-benzoquinol methylase
MTEPHQNSTAWDDKLLANPHAVADKRTRVQKMFAAIAPSYDLNNRLHSLWQDQRWRRAAVRLAGLAPTDVVVDVACGTGDLTLAMHGAKQRLGRALQCSAPTIGIDFTFEMLPLAEAKCGGKTDIRSTGILPVPLEQATGKMPVLQPGRNTNTGFAPAWSLVRFINADALALPLNDASCDVLSIAFGIRNVTDPAAALQEFHRVLRPGGRVIVLEFSLPTNPILRGLYNFYFRKVLPRTATLISRDRTGAYKYLPESVNTFIGRQRMMEMMRQAGFDRVEAFPLTFGVCVCYRGVKE